MGHNELLISEALRTAPAARREKALISVKFGALRDAGRRLARLRRPPGRREELRRVLPPAPRRRPHRRLPHRPASTRTCRSRRPSARSPSWSRPGYVRHIGLTEVGAETIRRAAAVAPIADLQIEYSLISRGIEEEILPTARELGIGVTAYGVLSRGLICGHFTPRPQARRERLPRALSPASRARTSSTTSTWSRPCARSPSRRASRSRRSPSPGCSPAARTSCRWSAPAPASGWRRPSAPWTSTLDAADLAAIEDAVPADAAAGDRYAAAADGPPRQRALTPCQVRSEACHRAPRP